MTVQGLIQADRIDEVRNELTPLMVAVKENKNDLVKAILQYRANINYINKDYNALMYACLYGRLEICRFLILKGSDVNAESENGFTALNVAADKNNADIMRLLIANNADVNHQNKFGMTALMISAQKSHPTMIRELLLLGADPDIRNNDGRTARQISEYPSIQQILQSYSVIDPEDEFEINLLAAESTADPDTSPILPSISNITHQSKPSKELLDTNKLLRKQIKDLRLQLSLAENKNLILTSSKIEEPFGIDELQDEVTGHLLHLKSAYDFMYNRRKEILLKQDLVDDIVLCGICLSKKKEFAANCGHIYCEDCIKLEICPNDRAKITSKLKIYL